MDVSELNPQRTRQSVIAVPPLARTADGTLAIEENRKLIEHIEHGGVNMLLYGGNAMFYHLRPSEYGETLAAISAAVSDETSVIPSVGPTYGVMMDQAEVLKDHDFATAMVLPQRDLASPEGIARGVRAFAAAYEKPVVLYLKFANWLPTEMVRAMVEEGIVSWIKYAVVLDDPSQDDELRALVDAVGGERIVSGIGEQPAVIHMRDFGVNSFTSGCVCVAPNRSMQMLRAIQSEEFAEAEMLRERFRPLEDLRNGIHPISVLHAAVACCGIARTGPVLPLLADPNETQTVAITQAAESLLGWEREATEVEGA